MSCNIVALDIGNVCVELELEEIGNMLGYSSIFEVLRHYPVIDVARCSLEVGEIGWQEFLDIFTNALAPKFSYAQAEDIWMKLIGKEMVGLGLVIKELVDLGMKPVFFSNICHEHYEMIIKKLSFFHLMQGAVLSYKVGSMKPEKEIYEVMETKFCHGCTPALYIDDTKENIVMARQRGWNSHHFQGIEGLKKAVGELVK